MASIELQDVSVYFPLRRSNKLPGGRALIETATGGRISRTGNSGYEVRALQNVSLKVTAGDTVGIVGRNGAGKSTLLQVLAGIYTPQHGRLRRSGKVTALLGLGGGMDQQMNGYENIRLRALLLGENTRTIDEKIDDIAQFTGLGEFLNLPVSTYSQGMRARLLFSVVTAFDPEILILDEGIVTGDADFRRKATKRMEKFASGANILFLASHANGLLRQMCSQGLWLEKGRVKLWGPIEDVIKAYEEQL